MFKKTLAWALSVVMLIGMMSGIALVTSATEVTDPTTLVGAETLTFSGLVSGNDVLYSNAGFTTVSSEDELFTVKDISETTFFHGNYMGGCMKPYNNDYNVNFFKLDLTEFVAANGAAVDVYLRAKKYTDWATNMLAVGIGNGANGGGNNQYYLAEGHGYTAEATNLGKFNGTLTTDWQWCKFTFNDVTTSYSNVLVVNGTSLNDKAIFISDVVVTVKGAITVEEQGQLDELQALLAALPADTEAIAGLMSEENAAAYSAAVAAAKTALESKEGVAEALDGLKAAVAFIRGGAYDSVSFIGLVDGNDKVNGIDVDLGTPSGVNGLFTVKDFFTGDDYGAGITFVHGNHMGGCLKPVCSNYNVNFFKLDLTKFVEAHGSAVDVYIRAKQDTTWATNMLAVGIGNGANGGNNQYYLAEGHGYTAEATNLGKFNGTLTTDWQWCKFTFNDVTTSYSNVLVVNGTSLNDKAIFISDIIIAEQGTTAEAVLEDVQAHDALTAAIEAATGVSADESLAAALATAQAVQAVAPGNTISPLAARAAANLTAALTTCIDNMKTTLSAEVAAPISTIMCADKQAVARYKAAITAASSVLSTGTNKQISDAYVELLAAKAAVQSAPQIDPTALVGETLTFKNRVSVNDQDFAATVGETVDSKNNLFTANSFLTGTVIHAGYPEAGGSIVVYSSDYNVNFFKLDLTEFVAAHGSAVDVYIRAKQATEWDTALLAVGYGYGVNGGRNNQYYYGAGSTKVGNGYLSTTFQWCKFTFDNVTASYSNVLTVSGTGEGWRPLFITDVIVTVKDALTVEAQELDDLVTELPTDSASVAEIEDLMSATDAAAYKEAVAAAQAALDNNTGVAEALAALQKQANTLFGGQYDQLHFSGRASADDTPATDVTITGDHGMISTTLTNGVLHSNHFISGGCYMPKVSDYNSILMTVDISQFGNQALTVYIKARPASDWGNNYLMVGGQATWKDGYYYANAANSNIGEARCLGALDVSQLQWYRYDLPAGLVTAQNGNLIIGGTSTNDHPIAITDIIICPEAYGDSVQTKLSVEPATAKTATLQEKLAALQANANALFGTGRIGGTLTGSLKAAYEEIADKLNADVLPTYMQLVAADNFEVQIGVELSTEAQAQDVKVQVTFDNDLVIEAQPVGGVCIIGNISPDNMGKTFTVTGSTGEGVEVYSITSSMKDYAKKLYDSEVATEKALGKALLNYGAYTQAYRGDIADLVNEVLAEADKTPDPVVPADSLSFSNSADGVKFTAINLVVTDSIKLVAKTDAAALSAAEVVLAQPDGCNATYTVSGNAVTIVLPDPTYISDKFTITIGGNSLTFSVSDYCARQQSNDNTNLVNLCNAILAYEAAVEAI